jgi:dTMP kinase
MKQSFVIALDGPDGVGKTTQLNLLRDFLGAKGKKIHVTRASGGSPIGEMLRSVSLSSLPRPTETDTFISLAMFAALADDVKNHSDEVILIDRSPLAMVAYNAYGGQLPEKSTSNLIPARNWVLRTCADTFKTWDVDILIFLDAPQAALNTRRKERQTEDYFENQDEAYHQRVRQGYYAGLEHLESLAGFPTRIRKIDASPDIQTINQSIVNMLREQLQI